MSLFETSIELFAALFDASIAPLLIVKWTAVLALAWLAHGMLVGRNPRWRVALWRSTVVGLAIVAVLSAVRPIVTYRSVRRDSPSAEVEQTVPIVPATVDQGAAAIIVERQAMAVIRPLPAIAPSTVTIRRDEPATAVTTVDVPGFQWASRLTLWFSWVWLAGVVLLTVRLILGSLGLARIIRRSSDVPDEIIEECRMTAARLGCHWAVRMRRTSEVASPCLAGLWHPILLLPETECDNPRPDDLRAILAHELAHARGHDLIWNAVLHLTSIVLWFHPLAWRPRSAHAAACDAVCDAVAADLLGDVVSYSRTLARLAIQGAGSVPCHGLAMARKSDVGRRIESLQRTLYRSPLPRRHLVLAMLAVVAILFTVGGFGITRAQQASSTGPRAESVTAPLQTEVKKSAGKLFLRAVSAETNEPIEGVSIQYQGQFGEKSRRATVKTAEDGTAMIEWAAGVTVQGLWLDARKPGLSPVHVVWTDERHPLELPAAKELRFEPGTTIGGIVRDEAAHAIEGATVEIHAPPTEYEGSNYVFTVGKVKTDAQGRWRLDDASKNLAGTWTAVTHPRYRRGGGAVSRDLDSVTILKKGLTVTGRVVNAMGQPVKRARAVIGHDIWGTNPPSATTDAHGEFTLVNCDAGPSIVTVQADGFSPRFVDVRVEEGAAPVVIALTEPGAGVRGRVVDVDGKPVKGAFVAADTWRGHRSIRFRVNTDREGRFQWQSAPKDVVLYDFGKEGYMSSRHVALTASEREQTVVLYPKLVITGRVSDAGTHRPVTAFRVVQGRQFEGRDQVYWAENAGVDVSGSQYTSLFTAPSAALLLRIEAPGYKPAESRAFRPNEGRQTFDFALQRADGPSGMVLLPDGRPASGTEVVVATRENRASLRLGRFDRNSNAVRYTTGPDGRFTFAPPVDRFLLIALNDAGFADASSDEFAKSGKLVLQPWATIDGGVRIGPRSGANQEVSFQPIRPDRGGGIYVFDYGYTTRTDDRGRFVFDRVIPGPGTVARNVVVEFGGGRSTHYPCWQESLDVKPGQTAQVKIGGNGRPVTGRAVLDGVPEAPVDWTRSDPATIVTSREEWSKRAGAISRFAANLDKDGRFRVEDVPAGKWELTVDVNAVPDPQFCGAGTEIGKAVMTINVPEMPGGRSFEALDVGTITAKLYPTLKPGDLAPDFTAQQLGGGRIRLSEYRGKLVLLDFWATWCGPCLAEMPGIKDIHETFGRDPRFVLAGMSCDERIETPARYAKENGFHWTQGLAGSLNGGVAASFLIRAIPATFLVGPDGRIIAKNLRGAPLKEAIRKALTNEQLFSAAKAAVRPPRFPVTRFAPEAADKPPSAKPAVVVMDDCDEDFQEARPHHDGLRFLSERGSELRTLKEFNTCQSVSASHGVAIDAERGRVYVCEMVGHAVTALDVWGRKLWRVEKIHADALAVDPKTGNVWCSGGMDLVNGETVVLDVEGKEIDSVPVRAIDLAYDPRTDGFWLVGYGITKLSRKGDVLFHRPREGWACVSVSVNPTDGSTWIVEREHPDEAHSKNLLWHLDANGGVIQSLNLGKRSPFAVAYEPRMKITWAVNFQSEVLRFAGNGRELPPLPIAAVAIAISPTTGGIWVTTKTEVLRLDETGAVQNRTPLGASSNQSWLAAF